MQTTTAYSREEPAKQQEPRFFRYYEAYAEMAYRVRYRPQAPSDFEGNVCLTEEQPCNLDKFVREAAEYAAGFMKEEDTLAFYVGCSNYITNKAFVWTIEAARLLCAGGQDRKAQLLLSMAVNEIDQVRKQRKGGRHD